jgi:sarcosine oxidase
MENNVLRNEDFLIDRLPTDPRIVVGSACSGHGFKFAPLFGKALAELSLKGKTTIPEFEEAKRAFSLKRSD